MGASTQALIEKEGRMNTATVRIVVVLMFLFLILEVLS
jgi:hypothetical protein